MSISLIKIMCYDPIRTVSILRVRKSNRLIELSPEHVITKLLLDSTYSTLHGASRVVAPSPFASSPQPLLPFPHSVLIIPVATLITRMRLLLLVSYVHHTARAVVHLHAHSTNSPQSAHPNHITEANSTTHVTQ